MNSSKGPEANFYKCKKCGHEFYDTWNHCPNCRTPKGKSSVRPLIWSLLILSIAAFFLFNPIENIKSTINSDPSNIDTLEEENKEPEIILTPIQTPPTGIYQNYTSNKLIASFEIRNHNDDFNYLMKFNDYSTNQTIFTVFLNKNENCNIKVPLGNYIITLARGNTWYGDDILFGENTNYMKYDKLISFYQDGLNIQGHYIDMTPTPTGNLDTDYISENDF